MERHEVAANRILSAVCLAVVMAVCHAAPDWAHQDAVARLRTSAGVAQASGYRVDLPRPLAGSVKGVAASLDGQPAPAVPIRCGDDVIAVWVGRNRSSSRARAAEANAADLPLHIYLFADDRVPLPIPEEGRRPARMLRATRSLLTRPFTVPEAVRMMNTLLSDEGNVYRLDVAGIGKSLDRPGWQEPPERRSALMVWSGAVVLDAPAQAAFGSDQRVVTWYAFVNGVPAGDWRTAQGTAEAGFFGEPRPLQAGLQHVDFFVVQRVGEPIPQCLWRLDGAAPQPLPDGVPAEHPHAVELQMGRDGPVLGFAFNDLQHNLFEDTGESVLSVAFPTTPEDAPVALQGADVRQRSASGAMVISGLHLPGVTFPAATEGAPSIAFPARSFWQPGQRVFGSVRLGRLPLVVAADDPVQIEAEVTFSAPLGKVLLEQVRLQAVQESASGQALTTDAVGSGRAGVFRAPLRLHPEAVRVRFEVDAAGIPLLRPVGLRVCRPDGALSGLEAAGEALFHGGERVLLVCRPLRPLPSRSRRSGPALPPRLGILDDFVAVADAPGASLLPERRVGRNWEPAPWVCRESASGGGESGTRPDVSVFPAFYRLLDMRLDAVVLAVGAADLRRGRRAEDICLHLLFMAQAAAAAGTAPVLLALPELPGVPPSDSRRAALLCKEMAWRLDVPAVDAHSAGRLKDTWTTPFTDTFATASGTVALRVPNDQGREWISALIEQALADWDGRPVR